MLLVRGVRRGEASGVEGRQRWRGVRGGEASGWQTGWQTVPRRRGGLMMDSLFVLLVDYFALVHILGSSLAE